MTPHIEAKKGEYHKTVLMPGDPLRARFIAANFLDNVKCINTVRNCLGYSGEYKGKKVSVQASGMGQPSLGIYAHELFTFYDIDNIIRVGSCGSLSDKTQVGDVVVALTASTDSCMSRNLIPNFILSPSCDYELLTKYTDIDKKAKVGSITSNDYFYQQDAKWFEEFAKLGVLAVDMETHVLYMIAAQNNKGALSVNTVSDNLVTGESISADKRETGFGEMIKNVLESLL